MRSRRQQSNLSQPKTTDWNRLVEVDKKYALMSTRTQRQVTSQLGDQLEYLLGKKEREIMKKRKLRQLEDQYEKEKKLRLTKINLKTTRSDKNREQGISEKRARSRRLLERFDTVSKRAQHENEEEIERSLAVQKRRSVAGSRSSKSNISSSRVSRSFVHQKDVPSDSIELQIENIESKIDQATTNSKFYYQKVAERARSYSKNFEETISGIRAKEKLDESKCIKSYYHLATHIADCSLKSKTFFQRESEKKKKIIEEKFTRAKSNLRQIDSKREEKLNELKLKFDRTFAPKSWKNETSETYLQKFLRNHETLQNRKYLQSETIVMKHLDLTLKNKALKEKREKMHQTLKKVEL